MKTLSYPKSDILESPDQYLQSCKVDPIPEKENFDENVNQKIQGYVCLLFLIHLFLSKFIISPLIFLCALLRF